MVALCVEHDFAFTGICSEAGARTDAGRFVAVTDASGASREGWSCTTAARVRVTVFCYAHDAK